jgi:hypothetical protein
MRIKVGDRIFYMSDGIAKKLGTFVIATAFVDRDPVTFPIILYHLRGYKLKTSILNYYAQQSNLNQDDFYLQLYEDIEFYKLPELKNQLDTLLSPVDNLTVEEKEKRDEFVQYARVIIQGILIYLFSLIGISKFQKDKIYTILLEEESFLLQLYSWSIVIEKIPWVKFSAKIIINWIISSANG